MKKVLILTGITVFFLFFSFHFHAELKKQQKRKKILQNMLIPR